MKEVKIMRKLRKNHVTVENTVEAYNCHCTCFCVCACISNTSVHAGLHFGMQANNRNTASNARWSIR